ncbi:MAG: YjbF family lipoprotein [Nevskia sp.]|nr:YjbF family lipoprotein [Nevskia sp.]
MLNRRQLLGGLVAVGASGCANNPDSTLNLFTKTVTGNVRSSSDYPLSAAQIHDLPYATLGVRVGDNPRAVMVLATVDGTLLQWVSADHVIFETEGGRLLRTRGLKRDLVDTRWTTATAEDPLAHLASTGTLPARGVYREIDVGKERAVAVESHFKLRGVETISIQGRQRTVHRVEEIAIVRDWRWETRNNFWFDAQSARVWRSSQQYCPELPPVELELLKPLAA